MSVLHLEDRQMVEISPHLTKPAHTSEPKAARIARVRHAMDVTSASGEAGEKDLGTVAPLVRNADCLIAQGQLAPAAIDWLTEFIGFGLVIGKPAVLRVVPESGPLGDRITGYDIELQGRVIDNPRLIGEAMAFSEIRLGPDVLTPTTPSRSETTQFTDATAMEKLLGRLGERAGTAWAVIPARRNDVFLANVATDHWGDLLDGPEGTVIVRDGIHPLPHVVANRCWQLSLPPGTSQLGQRLQRPRQRAEGRTYNVLRDAIRKDYDHYVSDCEDLYVLDDELFSMAFVSEGMPGAGIPVVDVIVSKCGYSVLGIPYTKMVGQLPYLVKPRPSAHPPRVIVAHLSEEDYTRLGSLAF